MGHIKGVRIVHSLLKYRTYDEFGIVTGHALDCLKAIPKVL